MSLEMFITYFFAGLCALIGIPFLAFLVLALIEGKGYDSEHEQWKKWIEEREKELQTCSNLEESRQ